MGASVPYQAAARKTAARLAIFAAFVALGGCAEDGAVPNCENCGFWSQLTAGLGRFPEPHPTDAKVFVFSTVEKTPGAPDANRQSDEDLWIAWVVDENDPSRNRIWQITDDALGGGDNFYPRWSPTGGEIAFVHVNDQGRFEVWRMAVAPPTGPDTPPLVGTPELVSLGRDPAWADDDRIVFVRDDKLFSADLSAGPAPRGGYPEVQLTFNPPIFASATGFVDRHPDFAPDGGGVFNTLGRDNVADVFVRAFEIDNESVPPDTLPTDAFLLYQPPGGVPAYPLFENGDTLRTPAAIRSVPVGAGGTFRVGVRIDGRFLADTSRITYCDTTISNNVELRPGDSDTLQFHFQVARGTLRVRSNASNTNVQWTREDGLVSSSGLISNAGEARVWGCVMSYEVTSGVPQPPQLEEFLVSGELASGARHDTTVFIPPGDTTFVLLFPDGNPDEEEAAPRATGGGATVTVPGNSLPPAASGISLVDLRAVDVGAIWRLDLNGPAPLLQRVVGTQSLLQNPAISSMTAGGNRYVAYVALDGAEWSLWVQRLNVEGSGAAEVWSPVGDPVRVATPGSVQNLDCDRNVFHPRFVAGADPGTLRLIVAMSDCPDNAFEELGFDDDPWAVGEIRVWQVDVSLP